MILFKIYYYYYYYGSTTDRIGNMKEENGSSIDQHPC